MCKCGHSASVLSIYNLTTSDYSQYGDGEYTESMLDVIIKSGHRVDTSCNNFVSLNGSSSRAVMWYVDIPRQEHRCLPPRSPSTRLQQELSRRLRHLQFAILSPLSAWTTAIQRDAPQRWLCATSTRGLHHNGPLRPERHEVRVILIWIFNASP